MSSQPALDQPYGDDVRQKFDMYPGHGSSADTFIIFVHGGSWRRGDKHSYRFVGRTLAHMGYTTVIPNYRLYPNVTFPAYIEDVAAVVWHVAQNHSSKRLILMGHSAGGHMAAVLALDAQRYLKGASRPHIDAFIGLAGAYNPQVWPRNAAFGSAEPRLWTPLQLVTPAAPPMLLLHGRLDTTVRPSQTLALAEAVTAAGGRAEVHLYGFMEHFAALLPFVPGFRFYSTIRHDIRHFITSL